MVILIKVSDSINRGMGHNLYLKVIWISDSLVIIYQIRLLDDNI